MATTVGTGLGGGSAIVRTQADETSDYEDALKNFSAAAYTEWPNEAGVRYAPSVILHHDSSS